MVSCTVHDELYSDYSSVCMFRLVSSFVLGRTAPEQYKGATRGLYGPWNDNLSDEFTMRNGSILHVNSSESDLFIFGQSCEFCHLIKLILWFFTVFIILLA